MMPMTEKRSSADETVQRAQDLYETRIRMNVETDHHGSYIAIDIETGEYEIGYDYHFAAKTLLSRQPDADIGVLRIGYPTVGRIGGRAKGVQP